MALMLQWISQVERTPLEDGDASFHSLALRWLRTVEAVQQDTGMDQWPLIAKFFSHLEASADTYWHAPQFELSKESIDERDDAHEADGDQENDDESWIEEDDETDLFGAAYEDMIYRDSTDDGLDADLFDEQGNSSDFELEEEVQRLGQRLEFLTTVARLWRQVAIVWNLDSASHPERRQLLNNWYLQAVDRYGSLLALIEDVQHHPLPQPTGSHDSMVEFDRLRMIKDSVLEQIISTCVETADAGRLLLAASGKSQLLVENRVPAFDNGLAVEVLRAVLSGDGATVSQYWPKFAAWIVGQELLYVPLAKGGRPKQIVTARTCAQLIYDLLSWLPRLGLIREASQLLEIAQTMEVEQPVGPGAVTEYDRLFNAGYQAIVRSLVASAEDWDAQRCGQAPGHGPTRPSDAMLVEALQDLTESHLSRWLTHSRTLRLSVVERLDDDAKWASFVAFVERYGIDIFTQKFLNLGNLRAILHQQADVWLANLEQDPNGEELLLVQELGSAITREEAAKWLSIAIEAVVENYREYRDYNTTTTHSDHGELLYTLIDFLRLRAAYDRVAWNLRPVVMAHEILVRQNRPTAAELWQQALAERTAEAADVNLVRFEQLCDKYGIRLPSVAERLSERFTRPLQIDRVRALVGPAIVAADTNEEGPFVTLRQEIASLAQEPAGAGLDLPDWLSALEEEVTMVRCARRHRQTSDDGLRRLEQVRLSWEEWQRQIADDAT
jgi:hypothetical protein